MPTLGQSVWTTSFAQSFANQHGLALYARDFGFPVPAPIPFGLAGAWPCGWLILAGLHPADAYTAMVAFWLTVAFAGAYGLARQLAAGARTSAALAVLWLTLPIVWEHVDYSMLSLGIALLPAYIFCSLRAIRGRGAALLLPFAAAFIAVFMDGYTFIMYAAAAAAIIVAEGWIAAGSRVRLVTRAVLIHVLALGLAYTLYKMYVHPGQFEHVPLEFFRAWGLDLSFIAIPTRGEHWLWDALGMGVVRTGRQFFGDASTWATTFCLPMLLLVFFAIYRLRKHREYVVTFVLVLLMGFYLSLGPSLKVNSQRLVAAADDANVMMSASEAVMPTGAAILYRQVPGFSLMRATYRWAALALLAGWILIAIAAGRSEQRRWIWPILAVVVILCEAPHPVTRLRDGANYRRMLLDIDRDFAPALPAIGPIAFAPYGNDFLAAYAAARKKVTTFNVGGDKNLGLAAAYWPASMLALNSPPGPDGSDPIVAFLREGAGTAVVLPYVNLLASAHFWPCPVVHSLDASSTHRLGTPSHDCIALNHDQTAVRLVALAHSPFLDIVDLPYFAVVTLHKPAAMIKDASLAAAAYPMQPMQGIQTLALGKGWYGPEPTLVWSNADAVISLPVPSDCKPGKCTAVAHFAVFGAQPDRLSKVIWSVSDDAPAWQAEVVASSEATVSAALPLAPGAGLRQFRVRVPAAISPAALSGSGDSRVLGVALMEIDLVRSDSVPELH